MVIVDTSVWIGYFTETQNPETAWLDRELGRTAIGITDLILCEVLQGVRTDEKFRRVRERLSTLQFFRSGGEDLAVASAQNYRFLRAHGHTVRKAIDCLTATLCLEQGHALLHRDRDFDPFEQRLGLRVVHPQGAFERN